MNLKDRKKEQIIKNREYENSSSFQKSETEKTLILQGGYECVAELKEHRAIEERAQ